MRASLMQTSAGAGRQLNERIHPERRKLMDRRWILAAAIGVGATLCSQAQQVKPEDQLKLRKAAFSLMNYSLGNLDAMAEGKRPYVKEEAIRYADLLAQLATMPKGFFGEGSDKGETRAKPEVWTNRADFDAKMDKMVSEAARLPQTARSGDAAALKKVVHDVDAACGACHDDYRLKRKG
jgi:cytochrome c556